MLRDLNGVKIRQNHKTGFFNANDLLELHNSKNGVQKSLDKYLDTKSFKELENAVIKDHILNTPKTGELDFSPIETKRGKYGGTWMDPYIFIDFAMWLSPEFKLTCIKWIFDKLIMFRDECGDGFKAVNEALFNQKPNLPHWEYANEAKMINKLVFGNPDKGQRNSASEDQLGLLKSLQKADIKLIEQGYDFYERFDKLKTVKKVLLLTS
jgi:hypothetical protein